MEPERSEGGIRGQGQSITPVPEGRPKFSRKPGVPDAPGFGGLGWKAGVPDAPGFGGLGWKPVLGLLGWGAAGPLCVPSPIGQPRDRKNALCSITQSPNHAITDNPADGSTTPALRAGRQQALLRFTATASLTAAREHTAKASPPEAKSNRDRLAPGPFPSSWPGRRPRSHPGAGSEAGFCHRLGRPALDADIRDC